MRVNQSANRTARAGPRGIYRPTACHHAHLKRNINQNNVIGIQLRIIIGNVSGKEFLVSINVHVKRLVREFILEPV